MFNEMSTKCPECEMRFTRRDNMKRHFNRRHENMKFIPPPPPPPPPPSHEGYVYTPPPPRGPELSSLQHQTETEEPYTTDDRTWSFSRQNFDIIPHPRSYCNIKL